MRDFLLVEYHHDLKDIWDDVVKVSKNGNFLHFRNYIDYHSHRFNEKSVIIFSESKPLAIFPCNLRDNVIVSHEGLTYAGLIYGTSLHMIDVLEIFNKLIDHFMAQGVTSLVYKAIPHIFHKYPSDEDLYALFRLNAQIIRRDISTVIPLDNALHFSELRKRKIRKAEANSISFIELTDFEDYYELLLITLKKFDKSPTHTLNELKLLRKLFPEKIRLFGTVKEGKLLAGALVYDFGVVAHTQYLASSEKGREMGALDFVLANLISIVYKNKSFFSFGISTENAGRYLNEGLIFQKEGFGGRGIIHDFYELNLK